MSFDKFLMIIILIAILFYGRLFLKGIYYTIIDDREFRQAGVRIDFTRGTITVKGKSYPVGKVTGIRWEALTSSHKHGNSIAKTVTISLDDIVKPHHKILFISKGHAQKFMQRLAVALRKAGGPDFV
ncbi:hypothetical protein Q4E93_10015 [Flavitalea sp. BT771]|uniref:hypothetical protein n=1 Tax=Flavitalea sp. BT771 TaxID=3063329 RepID=UPI0026E24454|nr:hypothetical protein [Flavitalea sp. BT771]MDO6430923.1 hypothetical protein [Flavitalea sp. BT771]MDV6218937.1 hypothetical protein [Flavitalea sp. BT771]